MIQSISNHQDLQRIVLGDFKTRKEKSFMEMRANEQRRIKRYKI
jgi:hypothetical protein